MYSTYINHHSCRKANVKNTLQDGGFHNMLTTEKNKKT